MSNAEQDGTDETTAADAATVEVTAQAQRVVLALYEIVLGGDRLRREMATALGVSGSELLAMAHLAQHPGSTPGELATVLGLAPSGVSTLLDGLEAGGFARRRPHPTDRRSRLVELTPGGWHAVGWIHKETTRRLHPMLTGHDAVAVAAFIAVAGDVGRAGSDAAPPGASLTGSH